VLARHIPDQPWCFQVKSTQTSDPWKILLVLKLSLVASGLMRVLRLSLQSIFLAAHIFSKQLQFLIALTRTPFWQYEDICWYFALIYIFSLFRPQQRQKYSCNTLLNKWPIRFVCNSKDLQFLSFAKSQAMIYLSHLCLQFLLVRCSWAPINQTLGSQEIHLTALKEEWRKAFLMNFNTILCQELAKMQAELKFSMPHNT